jgi:hypothetical protein
MRIVDVAEITKPIASPIRNAYIDFSKMTASLVAVVTEVMRDGRRVVGYGFNFERSLWSRRPDPGTLPQSYRRSRSEQPARRRRHQSRSAPDLGRDDVQ